jgi:glucosamine--fructose-6-phosphate aminotransferase (isomerizing)
MCGIVGYIGEQNSIDVLLDGLHKLEYRGYDSAGVAVVENNDIKVVKAKGRLSFLEEKLEKEGSPKGFCGIAHTRWATHGEPSDVNSHPHSSDRLSVVHNGIIENYSELKTKLEAKGYKFLSQTDTEVLALLLDFYYNGDPFEAISKAIHAVKGSYAMGIIFKDEPDTIYAVRKDSPLIIGLGDDENLIASDIPAILSYTKDYILLDENIIAKVEKDSVRLYNSDREELPYEVKTAEWDVEAAQKGGYPHFMLKEIFEQPAAFAATVMPRLDRNMPSFASSSIPDEIFENINRVYFVACGTAMHAGLIGRYVFEKLAHIPCEVAIASEFRYGEPLLNENDLVIIISQSGETADSLAALRLAKEKGVKTLGVVNVIGSSIAREADYVIHTGAGPEIAVASTKAYTVQLAIMYLLALRAAFVNGSLSEKQVKEYCKELKLLPDKMQKVLDRAEEMKRIAYNLQNADNMFFIGRGVDYALSCEGSLKLKEISYIHSESYAAGELKHGTISLIEENTPVVAVATQEHLFLKTVSNIKETVTRGAKALVICNEGFELPDELAAAVFTLPVTDACFTPTLAVLPLQLLAYYTSVLRGCDVDKPRNLAKSVTVE